MSVPRLSDDRGAASGVEAPYSGRTVGPGRTLDPVGEPPDLVCDESGARRREHLVDSFSITLGGLPATQRLAEEVAAVLRPGDVLGLDGDLGAGKTTFVRFLARALGVTAPVTSPTFTLAHHYEASHPARAAVGAEPLVVHHIDAYRLAGDADAEDLALAELFDSGGIVVVEWAERLTLPPDRLDLHFAFPPELDTTAEPNPADVRIVTLTPRGPTWQAPSSSPPW